ncbi:MAG: class I SAM-dependent methyltransferase [Candidatus Eremiobacteraeota bacterium]|nr:class I SAM-dependent methyltransferase [Candidatus Eremiobacteraeota bacterium]
MRAAIAALSLALFGRIYEIARFPKRPRFRGLGLSDWPGYAERLRRVLEYRNTYADRPPLLDITAIPERERGRNDFLLSIDVFEHVPPPVSRAFDGAAALLKPGGALILSVPYTLGERTIEHFPSLHDFSIAHQNGVPFLINTTADGRTERFDDLRFHGGEGLTLEMRLFCKQHVERLLAATGFGDVQTVDRIAESGIIYDNPCSHTFIARRR